MANKTIYVKDTDLPLLEQAQEQLGDSVSSMFAEFLRERVANLTPVERGIIDLINQITRNRAALKKEPRLPQFLDGQYAEVEANAHKALKSLRAGEIRNAKVLWYAANAYHDLAERDVKEARALADKIAELLDTP